MRTVYYILTSMRGTGADHRRPRVTEVRPDRREAGEVPGGAGPARRRGGPPGGDLCRALLQNLYTPSISGRALFHLLACQYPISSADAVANTIADSSTF